MVSLSVEDARSTSRPASALQIGGCILRTPFLRNSFLTGLALALFIPLCHWLYLAPRHRQALVRISEEQASRTAQHLTTMLRIKTEPLNEAALPEQTPLLISTLKADFKLEKVTLFGPSGRVVFSSDPQERGTIQPPPSLTTGDAEGRIHSQLEAVRGVRDSKDYPTERMLVKISIPIFSEHAFRGAWEIVYDLTAEWERLKGVLWRGGLALSLAGIALQAMLTALLIKAASAGLARQAAGAALQRARGELDSRVGQRTQELIQSNEALQRKIGERRQAESALRESEARLRRLIETIPYGIREIDPLGTITFVNSAHSRLYGYSEEELIGRSMFELAGDEQERQQLQTHLNYLLEQLPPPSPWFCRERTKGGRTIDIQVDWNYKVDQQGRILGLITIISDISHRRQAEKALLDNIKFMNTLIDTIPNPVFFKDEQGVFLGCNVAYAEALGVPKEELLGRRIIDLTGISFKKMAEHYHRQDLLMITSPGIRIHEDQMITADGEQRDYILFKATFRDVEGKVAGLVGIMLDITARKKVEKELQESKNLFESFMHHLPGLAFIKNLQGQYIFVNKAFSNFSGATTIEVLGLCDHQVWDGRTALQLQRNDQAVLTARSATSLVETFYLPNFQERYLLTTRFPIFKEDSLAALGGIAIDVTERTEAEHRRQQLERQLQQSQKMEALGTLAGGIAHDFNNILASIIGYTQIALAEIQKGSDLQGYLLRVLSAGERAGELVKQILTFSRKSELELTPVKINKIIREVLKLVRATLPVTIEIVQDISSDAVVMADPVQIHQVMMNLCANAGYAMRAKGGRLKISLTDELLDESVVSPHAGLEPGPYIKLSVSDTGTGIAPEHIERIFDPFFTTKPKGEGTGMGLSVVHGIVSSLAGAVTVQSEPGQGACFEVYLPAMERPPSEISHRDVVLSTGSERILLVDDEVFQTDMLKHMLGLLGYHVQACNSGAEALERLKTDPMAFDLVISDLLMPGMTGDELATRMLRLRPDLPIILSTGFGDDITEKRARSLGVRCFAVKPLNMEQLSRLIRQALEKKEVE